ncbi:hypothetical protein [Streptomyces griseorubiginosus]|uniref:hypothetical protein n=1 Tax=Streptomyces griseorubiginosus TaxID=67304 RepID=UPI00340C5C1E
MTTQRLNPDLLSHLVDEFMDDGRRAVGFLRSAEALVLMPDDALPGHPELIAYSLREAMKAIPASQRTGGGGEWSVRSRQVVDAKKRYDLSRGLPGEEGESALDNLMRKIDEMAITHTQERIHQKRLLSLMISRTGAVPVSGGTKPVEKYQKLLDTLDDAVHGNMTMPKARETWDSCLTILNQLFLPPEIRYSTLDDLADTESPGEDERKRLTDAVSSPQHLIYFLKRIRDPLWLDLLFSSDLLTPSHKNGGWAVLAAVDYLSENHREKLASILDPLFDKCSKNEEDVWYVARVALELGEDGHGVLLRALAKYRKSDSFCSFAITAAEKASPSAEFVQHVADKVLSADVWADADPYTPNLTKAYCEGLTEANCADRIKLLCYKLKSVSEKDHDLLLFRYDQGHLGESLKNAPRPSHFSTVLVALAECLRKAVSILGADALLQATDPLKGALQSRVRVWILANSIAANNSSMIVAISEGIPSRPPTADDADLLDKITQECHEEDYEPIWKDSLGAPPDLAALGEALADRSVPKAWRRPYQWSAILPSAVWQHWADAIAVMSAAWGEASREQLKPWPRFEFYSGATPIAESELANMPPLEAAHKVAAWRPDNLRDNVSARELGRTLEELIKKNVSAWSSSPIAVASALRHPTYIGHYLSALAGVEELPTSIDVAALMDLIKLTRTHPWQIVELGEDSFDFDDTWRPVECAGVAVIKKLAEKDIGFADRSDYAWQVLTSEVRSRDEVSGFEGEADHLLAAVNRSCTVAFEAVISFLAFERRKELPVRSDFYELLRECLLLEGSDGAHFRAIIGPRFGFLRYLDETWFLENHGLIFGDSAPSGMGQLTVDLAVRWGQPRRWLLEAYPAQVRDAVVRNVENSMDQYLVGVLKGFAGYSVAAAIKFLVKLEKISQAGQLFGHLLRGGEEFDEPIVANVVEFWSAALKLKSAESLYGFGWMAEVSAIAEPVWNRFTIATLRLTAGNIDWSHRVAGRAASQEQSVETLRILNLLVRGLQGDWDRRNVGGIARDALSRANSLSETADFKRLRTTLLERGILE